MRQPVILVSGTPGTGKSRLAQELASSESLHHIDVGAKIRNEGLFDEFDDELDTHIIDDTTVVGALEDSVREGNLVLDYHSCDLFPQEWFDMLVVLTCDNAVLYDRLTERGYAQEKLDENIEAEIMCTVQDEAYTAFEEARVWVLQSNTESDMEQNLTRIRECIQLLKHGLDVHEFPLPGESTGATEAVEAANTSDSSPSATSR